MHEAGLLAAAIADALAAGEAGIAGGAVGAGSARGAGEARGAGDRSGPGIAGIAGDRSGAGPAGGRRPVAVVIRVRDPIHIGVDAARMHAELALRARGLDDVAIEVTADPVACPMCDVMNDVQPDHPYCEACGWPLPDKGGHQVEATVRWSAS